MNLPELPAARQRLPSAGDRDPPAAGCSVVLTHLWDWLDGEGSADIAREISLHLPSCAPCARQLLVQQRFFSSVAALRRRTAPDRLRDHVLARLAAVRDDSPDAGWRSRE